MFPFKRNHLVAVTITCQSAEETTRHRSEAEAASASAGSTPPQSDLPPAENGRQRQPSALLGFVATIIVQKSHRIVGMVKNV